MTVTLVCFVCVECDDHFDISCHEYAPICPKCSNDTLVEHEKLAALVHFSPEHRPLAVEFIHQWGERQLTEIIKNAEHIFANAGEAAMPDTLRTLVPYEQSIVEWFTEADKRLADAGIERAGPSIEVRSQQYRDAYVETIAKFGPDWRRNIEAIILLGMISHKYEDGVEYAVEKYKDWSSD